MKTNAFDELVENLKSGGLTLNQIQMAIREYYRQRADIPDGVRDLLCGAGSLNAGLIYKIFQIIDSLCGNLELAYRRGEDNRGDHDSWKT